MVLAVTLTLSHRPPPPPQHHPARLPVRCRIRAPCRYPTPPRFVSPRTPALPLILTSHQSSNPPCPTTSARPTIFRFPPPSHRLARCRFQHPCMLVPRPTFEPSLPPCPPSPRHTASPDRASCRTFSHPTCLPADCPPVPTPPPSSHSPAPHPPRLPFPHPTTPHTGHHSPPPLPPLPPNTHIHTPPHLPHAPAPLPANPTSTHPLLSTNQLSNVLSLR